MPQPSHAAAERGIDAIEAEMKRLGWWDLPVPPAEFSQAFGMDVMSFPQWLRYVFIPRVRQILAERGQFPASSMVATQAIREFDGMSQADDLVSLLSQFDALIDEGGQDWRDWRD